jgi:hypothetical protein
VILAYKHASATRIEPTVGGQPSPPTSLLAVGAVGSLSALAIFSIDQAAAGLLGRSAAPILSTLVTPFPFVAATLLTFGFLPAPIGGYARPASISIGLMTYWAIAAASAKTSNQVCTLDKLTVASCTWLEGRIRGPEADPLATVARQT